MSIICHEHRFIFLKTRKTASTSLQAAFSRVCKEGDTVTQNSINVDNYIIRGEAIKKRRGKSHNYPVDIAAQFPKEWKDYRKIVAVRDPYEAALSLATHGGNRKRIKAWLEENITAGWLDMETFVYPFDGTKIDYVIKFENLHEDYQTVCDYIGCKAFKLPHLRMKKNREDFPKLNDEARKLIRESHIRILRDYY